MKKLSLLSLFTILVHLGFSQDTYTIKVTLKPFTSGNLYLGHHFGNKQYIIDSARVNEKSEAIFSGKTALFGGVYMIIFPQRNGWLEILIDKQRQLTIEGDTSDVISKTKVLNDPQNDAFRAYQITAREKGRAIAELQQQLKNRQGDSPAIAGKMSRLGQELQQYRDDYAAKHPGQLLSAIFSLLREPQVPSADKHPDGRYDSSFAYRYYRDHYWDGISFKDERLMRTPVFQPKFQRYFSNVLPQSRDSLIREADRILDIAEPNKEMFKYLLATLTEKYVNPQYMGQDAVFVHLFEKYYATGKADYWLNDKYRKFVFDRAYSLMANQIGEKAAPMNMVDTGGRPAPLYEVRADYLVVCFWDPTCSHCKVEVPKLDSMFRNKWKARGVKLYGVMTDGGKENWVKYIRENNLRDWIHVYQTDEDKNADYAAGRANFRQLYDVYQTPMLYLLDKDKRIIAKRLNYEQIDNLLDVKTKQ